jgi:hypothetical protein
MLIKSINLDTYLHMKEYSSPPSLLFTGPLGPGLGVVDTVEEYNVEEIPEILFSLTITSCNHINRNHGYR